MKKIGTLIAALALVFTMGISSAASSAALSVEAGADNIKDATDVNSVFEITIDDVTLTDDQTTTLADQIANDIADDNFYVEAVDVNAWRDGELANSEITSANKLTVTFVRDNNQKVLAVYYWNEDAQKWDVADFSQNGDKVTATFEHLCPVSFVLSATETVPTKGGSGDKGPQTGYDTTLWAVAAVSLAACAGFCFFKASKKAA